MVRTERLELSHLAAPEPKSGVSTNFTTSAVFQTKKPGYAWRFGIWGGRWGSNPRPQEPQSCALPTELRPPYCIACARAQKLAHPAGLEPATIRLEGGCSIQLSYGRFYLQSIRSADFKLRLMENLPPKAVLPSSKLCSTSGANLNGLSAGRQQLNRKNFRQVKELRIGDTASPLPDGVTVRECASFFNPSRWLITRHDRKTDRR